MAIIVIDGCVLNIAIEPQIYIVLTCMLAKITLVEIMTVNYIHPLTTYSVM